jgi:hypothetical protein
MQRLSQIVLECFRARPELTVAALRSELLRRGHDFSQRAVYRELGLMLEREMLVKEKQRYHLNLTWVLSLIDLAEDLYVQATTPALAARLLPPPGRKAQWTFAKLKRMDSFWVQLMFLLFARSRSRTMFCWVPHFWFHLLHYKHELQAMHAMRVAGNRIYMSIGHDTYIDRQPERYWSRRVYQWSYAPSPFRRFGTRYLYQIDGYLLTAQFDRESAGAIHGLCCEVRSARELEQRDLGALFERRCRGKLTLEHAPLKARRVEREFRRFFGVSPRSGGA